MRASMFALAVALVSSACAAPFLDDFATDTTANYTVENIYG